MTRSSEFSRQLKKAVRTKDWNSLDAFLVEDIIKELNHSEKENLAQLFFEQGEFFLEEQGKGLLDVGEGENLDEKHGQQQAQKVMRPDA